MTNPENALLVGVLAPASSGAPKISSSLGQLKSKRKRQPKADKPGAVAASGLEPEDNLRDAGFSTDNSATMPMLHDLSSGSQGNNASFVEMNLQQHEEQLPMSFHDEEEQVPDDSANQDDGFLVQATLVSDSTDLERAQYEEDTRQRLMDEMILDAHAAEVVEFDEEAQKRRRRRNYVYFGCGLLILVAVILGTVLGTRGSGEPEVETIEVIRNITPAPSLSSFPSSGPTQAPSTSVAPSKLSSELPSRSPSLAPSVSMIPSELPSAHPSDLPSSSPTDTPDNNYCWEATPISIGETAYFDTSVGSLTPSALLAAAQSTGPSIVSSLTPSALAAAAKSTGPSIVPPTIVSSLTPSALVADEWQTISPTIDPSGTSSPAPSQLVADSGVEESSDVGSSPQATNGPTFITISKESTKAKNDPGLPASNIFARRQSTLPQQMFTLPQERQFLEDGILVQEITDCISGVAYSAPGRWFKFRGVGPVAVTTCHQETTVNTSIQLYSDVLECQVDMGGPETCQPNILQSNQSGCQTFAWNSVVGRDYLILAHEDTYTYGYSGGMLALSIINNDKCQNAFGPFAIGDSFFASLTSDAATMDENVPECGSANKPSHPGVWFQMRGTGGLVKADTCDRSVASTQVSVFTGSCDNLECVSGNRNACGSQSLVSWNSEAGVLYYILVHGGMPTKKMVISLSVLREKLLLWSPMTSVKTPSNSSLKMGKKN